MKRLYALTRCFYKAGHNTVHHDGIEHAGYLAFLALLSLFPFLVLVVALAGFFGESAIGTEFVELLYSQLPSHVVAALKPRLDEIISGPPQGLLTIAIVGAIWTASSALEGMRTVLNRAYHVATPPAYIWRRLLSIAQLLIFSFVVLMGMSLLVVAPLALQAMESVLRFKLPVDQVQWSNYFYVITVGLLFCVVSSLYYILPNIRQRWRWVVPGAALVVALWLLAAMFFSLYLSNFQQVNLIYGSLGSIIAALLFFYIMYVIFIYGAELNYQLMRAFGEKIEQKEYTPAPMPDPED